ncbi:MAG: hypothetical protein JW742_01615 [Candidatus Aminicenantes bacterium]|nr:hypothetical protein [Candidatus Aminicenantes bacterium]
MNGGNNLVLGRREKRILSILAAIFGVLVVFLLYVAVVERPGLLRTERSLARARESSERAAAELARKKEEAGMWRQGRRDAEEVRTAWFYQEAEGPLAFMSDVEKILNGAAIEAGQKAYSYDDVRGEKAERINVTFNCACSYFMLKRLLDDIERFPRFLFLERLDFLKTPDRGQTLELSITLAGYRAQR